ncbi:hypothetical protein [Streptomyces sp. CB01881]|uniref:hypothetical protein n=1 Tax=Streptomyces sp. CB01881 TaxID=2078691 RepID=UPI000CDBD6A0|nr:hypothetical protein [Streptomyces sp. CB01881]AUY50638.1 hypothetical protein C2142_18715 [Streptomyces sp. CB01881]TYC74024.1 hypothetical protein EH183_18685 [Streptomyces sp. CB01881]
MTAVGGRRSSGQNGGRAAARLLLLCALLAGLFLMHGSPTSAGGCHRPEPAAAPVMAAAHAVAQHHGGPDTAAGLTAPRTHGDGRPAVSCVSARDRDGAALPAPGPYALAATALLPAALAGPRRRPADGPRAPPAAGRGLLLRKCVART